MSSLFLHRRRGGRESSKALRGAEGPHIFAWSSHRLVCHHSSLADWCVAYVAADDTGIGAVEPEAGENAVSLECLTRFRTDDARIKLKLIASSQLIAGGWLSNSILFLLRRCRRHISHVLAPAAAATSTAVATATAAAATTTTPTSTATTFN